MITFTQKAADGRRVWTGAEGYHGVSDPQRGIGLIVEPDKGRPLVWMVVSMYRRLDTGDASEPFIVEYGKN